MGPWSYGTGRSGRQYRIGWGASFSLMRTRSAIESACIFSMTRPRWTLMVFSAIPSLSAICLLSIPATTSINTSRSRGVSDPTRRRSSSRSAFSARSSPLRRSERRNQSRTPSPRPPPPLRLLRPLLTASPQRALDAVQQLLVVERLLQEIHRAALHGPHAGRHVAVAGDEHGWQAATGLRQRGLEVEAARTGKADVQHQTGRPIRRGEGEEGLGRRERHHLEADGVDEPRQRPTHGSVIVDHVHDRFIHRWLYGLLMGRLWSGPPGPSYPWRADRTTGGQGEGQGARRVSVTPRVSVGGTGRHPTPVGPTALAPTHGRAGGAQGGD